MAGMQEWRLCTIVRRPMYGAPEEGRIRRPGPNLKSLKMLAPEITRAVPLGSVTTVRAVSLAQHALDAFTAWRNTRATEKALLRLSDRQLRDIGLLRGEIATVAEDLARS